MKNGYQPKESPPLGYVPSGLGGVDGDGVFRITIQADVKRLSDREAIINVAMEDLRRAVK